MAKHLDPRLLSVAITLYEERNVTTAARKLGMSQPALSKSLSKLRRALGDELFVKTGYGMVPTPKAHALIEPARDALLLLTRVFDEPVFDPGTSTTMFTFALTELGETFLFPRIFRALQALAPHTRARVVCPLEQELIRGLETGDIDLAIGVFPELDKNKFFQQKLSTIDTVCLMRADHPLQVNSLSVRQYLELGHVAVQARGAGYTLERLLRRQRVSRNIVVTTTHFTALPAILQRSDLVATVSSQAAADFCEKFENLKIVKSPFLLQQPLVQHWHARYQNDSRNRWVRQLVKGLFKAPDEHAGHTESVRLAKRRDHSPQDRVGVSVTSRPAT